MNTKQLKAYAPQARKDFIAAVSHRAALFGITAGGIAPMTQEGDVAIVSGQVHPKEVANLRARLVDRVRRDGFELVMEAVAYTWFNRLVAIRFMELHGYLEHGYRVLSHPEGRGIPEVLEHATEVELPGLDRELVVELKLEGTRDEELYRLLLVAQCHALHRAMPFLFERIDDEMEILLPDRLLHTDSLVRRLVEDVEEGAWESIEIIGWLYQFYISEKKDEVIGKVVKSEDIPAATQLFTPNWIVKYMVQNSLGAQWLATYPDSGIKGQMEFYIEPAEQTEEVKAQLAAMTPESLNPEELTLIDPACGSGHILVEAYELFKAIYLERGYRPRDVPRLILEKNIFGLDIDERAAQLAGFALMMKGRADDRRLFSRGVELNIQALRDSADFDPEVLAEHLALGDYGLGKFELTALKSLFQDAKTFGSLIEVPANLASKVPALQRLSETTSQSLFVADAFKHLRLLVRQAEMLASKYDAVVANPPYMGSKYHNSTLKLFLKKYFIEYKKNLFSAFIIRGLSLTKPNGESAYVTPFVWLSISSYEAMRSCIFDNYSIGSLVKPSYTSFFDSAIVSLVTFVIEKRPSTFRGTFFDLGYLTSADSQPNILKAGIETPACTYKYTSASSDFQKIPGSPVAFWASDRIREVFSEGDQLGDHIPVRQGLATADNDRFVRAWPEVSTSKCGFAFIGRAEAKASAMKWFPYNKGGGYRKWYGNNESLINWEDDGRELNAFKPRSVIRNPDFYFRPSVTWSFVADSYFGVRYSGAGAVFDVGGSSAFPEPEDHFWVTGLLCSKQVFSLMRIMNPTVNFQVGNVAALPILKSRIKVYRHSINVVVECLISQGRSDWDAYERSWDFQSLPILTASPESTGTLQSSYTTWLTKNRETIGEMKRLEEENNRLFIEAYGLQVELTPEVPIGQITLTVNPAYRYRGNLTEEAQSTRFREDTMKELISYALGCMMGRYSLSEPGLIYAHSGNKDFDPTRYPTYPADEDGIIPLTTLAWFEDDATERLEEFLAVAWNKAHLEENLTFIAENLNPKRGETSRDTIRRYIATQYFKDHLKTYKNRPIYWLFTSGKHKAFQALVYLHRYHPGTLGRMRTEYVNPLQGKITARLEQLQGDIEQATSTAHGKRLQKQRDTLQKQHVELQDFDERLRHQADKRTPLDLDDGVKVNYGKFGDLLAEVKAVTGKKPVTEKPA